MSAAAGAKVLLALCCFSMSELSRSKSSFPGWGLVPAPGAAGDPPGTPEPHHTPKHRTPNPLREEEGRQEELAEQSSHRPFKPCSRFILL